MIEAKFAAVSSTVKTSEVPNEYGGLYVQL